MLVVAAIVALAGCGGGGGDDDGKQAAPSTTVVPNTNVSLQLGDVSADSAGPPAQVAPEQSQAILKVVGAYLDRGHGRPASRRQARRRPLGAVRRRRARPRHRPRPRGDGRRGAPQGHRRPDVTAQPIAVVGLGDQGGAIVLATATIDLDIQGVTAAKGDPLRIVRKGDLVLSPDASGAWKVTAFNIAVARSGGGIDAPTTTTPPPTTTKGSK